MPFRQLPSTHERALQALETGLQKWTTATDPAQTDREQGDVERILTRVARRDQRPVGHRGIQPAL